MKKILASVLALLLLNMHTAVLAKVPVPNNTEIILVPVEKVTSQNPQPTIRAEIKEDVIVNDTIIFKNMLLFFHD